MKKLITLCLAILLVLTMGIPAFADSYAPSAEVKEAPEVATMGTDPISGKAILAQICKSSDGNAVNSVVSGELNIFSYAQLNDDKYIPETAEGKIAYNNAKALMQAAFAEIEKVASAADLNKDSGDKNGLRAELAKRAEEVGKGYTADQFVVKDVFDLSVPDGYKDKVKSDNFYMKVTFKGDYSKELEPVIVYRCDGDGEWSYVDADDVTVNSDGSITVCFRSLCPIAILEMPEGAEPVNSFPWTVWMIFAILLFIILVILIVIIAIRHRNSDAKKAEPEKVVCGLTSEECTQEDKDCKNCPVAKKYHKGGNNKTTNNTTVNNTTVNNTTVKKSSGNGKCFKLSGISGQSDDLLAGILTILSSLLFVRKIVGFFSVKK